MGEPLDWRISACMIGDFEILIEVTIVWSSVYTIPAGCVRNLASILSVRSGDM